MNNFRELRADEIDVRVSMVRDSGFSLLLYKDARVDQNLLDEVFTPFGWRRSHQLIGDRLYCTVEIWDAEKKEWVSKQDVGTESNTEKEKGQASDSFKRACFNWGIGRELYTAPFIWISDGEPKDRYKVGSIKYTNGVITGLTIVHSKTGKVVYSYGNVEGNNKASDASNKPKSATKSEETTSDRARLLKYVNSKNEPDKANNFICKRYGVEKLTQLSDTQATDAINFFTRKGEKI